MSSPVLILLQQHLLCAAIGSKHRHVDLSVRSSVLHISCHNSHLVNNLRESKKRGREGMCLHQRQLLVIIVMLSFDEKQSKA